MLASSGEVRINPPMETVVLDGDRIVVVSADDDTVVAGGAAVVDESALVHATTEPLR